MVGRTRPWARRVLGVAVALAGVAAAAVLVIALTARSGWVREQVRSRLLGALDDALNGSLRVGAVEGNLLGDVTLRDVALEDDEGRLVLEADEVRLDIALRQLLRKRITLAGVRLVRPRLVLEQSRDGTWNVTGLIDSNGGTRPGNAGPTPGPPGGRGAAAEAPPGPGWGSRIRLSDVEVEGGTVIVRQPWPPPGPLPDAAARLRVDTVPGGPFVVREVRHLDARLADLVLVDPYEGPSGRVAALSATVSAFRDPPLRIRELEGRFEVTDGSLHVDDVELGLPASRVSGELVVGRSGVKYRGRIDADIVGRDLRWLDPTLPADAELEGGFLVRRDADDLELAAAGLDARFDGARVRGEGAVRIGDGVTATAPLEIRFENVDTRLVERLASRLGSELDVPADGTAEGRVVLEAGAGTGGGFLDAEVSFRHRADGSWSHLVAEGGLTLGDTPTVQDLTVRLDPLHLPLASEARGGPRSPAGVVAGTVRLDGPVDGRLELDADLTHRPTTGGPTSRVAARGGIELQGGVAARNLAVRLAPLQMEVVEAVAGRLPVAGTLEGRARLNGSPRGALAADVDVTHRDTTGTTRLVGTVGVGPPGPERSVEVDLRAPVLSLRTLGRLAPGAGLRGSSTATLEAEGPLARLAVEGRLDTPDGGALVVAGTIDAADPGRHYDLGARLVGLDAAALSDRAPATALWGTASVSGTGTDPAGLEATVEAALVDSLGDDVARGGVRYGELRVRGHAAGGMATVEAAELRVASATLSARGTLGLAPNREGELRYTLAVDSLSDFAGYVPDGGDDPATPRPALGARLRARARADSLSRAEATAVERAATSRPAAPRLEVDTLPLLPRDSLSGSIRLEGTAAGGLRRLSIRGEGRLDDVVARGNRVGRATVALDARGLTLLDPGETRTGESLPGPGAPDGAPDRGTGRPGIALRADLDTLQAGGFGFEAVSFRLEHRGGPEDGDGTLRIVVTQDPARDYRLLGRYDLGRDGRALRVDSLAIRSDTTRWVTTGPATVRWGRAGLEVDELELVSDGGSRVYADGRIPSGGTDALGADAAGDGLVLEVDDLPVAQVVGLIQDTVDLRGRLTLSARVRGTRAEPLADAAVTLADAVLRGTHLPDLTARVGWSDDRLRTDGALLAADTTWGPAATAEMRGDQLRGKAPRGPSPRGTAFGTDPGGRRPASEGGLSAPGGAEVLARFRGSLAVALPGDRLEGPRPLELQLTADSLPADALASFTSAVSDVRGRLRGEASVSGTLEDPRLAGILDVELAGLSVPDIGVRLQDLDGTIRLSGEELVVDSLTARSGGGTVMAHGAVVLGGGEGPRAELTLRTREAVVVNTDRMAGIRADTDLRIVGPVSSLAVTGTARIREGIVHVEVERPEALDLEGAAVERAVEASEVARETVPRHTPLLLEGLRAEVSLRVDRNTWIRALDGSVEVYTPADGEPLTVLYDRTHGLPVLSGVVHADRGQWTLAGRRFELTTGTATFLRSAELDPQLQFTAVHEVARPGEEPLEIQITVGGRLKAPRVTLSSDAQPPLPQTDLLTYLVFGTSSTSLMRIGGSGLSGGGAGELGALASQQLASVALGSLVDRAFSTFEARPGRYGLDVIHVSAAELPEELAFDSYVQNVLRGTQVEAGKYVTPRLFVAARARPTAEALPGLRTEYSTPFGFRWTLAWEPHYVPRLPTFESDRVAQQTRALSSFLFWRWRY